MRRKVGKSFFASIKVVHSVLPVFPLSYTKEKISEYQLFTNNLLKIYRYTIYTLFKCLSPTSNTLQMSENGGICDLGGLKMAVIFERVGRWK